MNVDALTPARPTLSMHVVARAAARLGKETILAAIIAAALFYLGLILLGYQPMAMVTGSMQKTIPVGSLVVSQSVDPDALEVGDVISFEKPIGGNRIDTHRIVAVRRDHGKLHYRTKGDSNPIVDPWLIQFEQGMTAHRMVFSVPHAGHALLIARSAPGRIAVIALACLLILLSVLKAIAATAVRKGGAAVPCRRERRSA